MTELARSAESTLPFVATLARKVVGEKAAARCDLGGLMEYRRSLTPDSYPWALATTEMSQALNSDSRVSLADSRDALGLRRTRLPWEVLPSDYRSLKVSTLAFGRGGAELEALPVPEDRALPAQVDDHVPDRTRTQRTSLVSACGRGWKCMPHSVPAAAVCDWLSWTKSVTRLAAANW